MTDEQKRSIWRMREDGMGYKTIANELGISRDAVRQYCRSNGLQGYAGACSMNIKIMNEKEEACDYCGKPVEQHPIGRPKRFCSDSCRRAWWKEHPEKINRRDTACYDITCIYCGKKFVSYGNKNRRYCSHNCYVKDRFWRYEEGKEPYVSPRVNKKLKVSKSVKISESMGGATL